MTDPTTTAAAEAIAGRNVALRAFILRLLDPEDLGLAVSIEVREAARQALGMHRKTDPVSVSGFAIHLGDKR